MCTEWKSHFTPNSHHAAPPRVSGFTGLFGGNRETRRFGIGASWQNATALHHEEHELHEGKSPLPCVRRSKLFLLFVSFVAQKIVSTMKSTKSMKATPTYLWVRKQDFPSGSSCPSWLGVSKLTALSTGGLSCQPIPVLASVEQSCIHQFGVIVVIGD